MNSIYYALFIGDKLVGIFDRDYLVETIKQEVMLGNVEGEAPQDTYDDHSPFEFIEIVMSTADVHVELVSPNEPYFNDRAEGFVGIDTSVASEEDIQSFIDAQSQSEDIPSIARIPSDK